MTDIDIKGIDKAELLAALVNGARPQGMGLLQDDGKPMTKADAQDWIDRVRSHDSSMGAATGDAPAGFNRRLSFDYVKGRPIKSDIGGDTFRPGLYDRDQGEGAAARVIAGLRAQMGPTATGVTG